MVQPQVEKRSPWKYEPTGYSLREALELAAGFVGKVPRPPSVPLPSLFEALVIIRKERKATRFNWLTGIAAEGILASELGKLDATLVDRAKSCTPSEAKAWVDKNPKIRAKLEKAAEDNADNMVLVIEGTARPIGSKSMARRLIAQAKEGKGKKE